MLLVALTEARWQQFREAFANHTTEKIYVAVVAGRPRHVGQADLRLAVTRHKPARVEVIPPEPDHLHFASSRRCTLSWRTTQRYPEATRLEIKLETGFLHQIRATLSHLDHPVLGDRLYGPVPERVPGSANQNQIKASAKRTPRLMLHAASLRLGDIEVQCPPPPEFMKAVAQLR